jgi:hypothetical protein
MPDRRRQAWGDWYREREAKLRPTRSKETPEPMEAREMERALDNLTAEALQRERGRTATLRVRRRVVVP